MKKIKLELFMVLVATTCWAKVNIGSVRDPFRAASASTKKIAKQAVILEGVVHRGKKKCVVLGFKNERTIVMQGERFKGYLVCQIGKGWAMLQKGKKQIKLLMD